jgi:hypothetical protein
MRPVASPRSPLPRQGASLDHELLDRQERAAKNQSLFREVNERVKDVNDQFYAYTAVGDWICECADDTCTERIEMTLREYEHIRSAGTRFFVAPADEHVLADVEAVVERNDRYWIVEKTELSAVIAKNEDPRLGGPTSLRT